MYYVRITEYVPGTDKIDIDIQTVKNSTPNAIIEGQLKMRSREVQATVDEGCLDSILNDRTHFEIFEDEALTSKVVDLDLRDVEFGEYLNKIYTEAAEKREAMRARRLWTV